MRKLIVILLYLAASSTCFASDFYQCKASENSLNISELSQLSAMPLKVGNQVSSLPTEPFDTSKYQGKTVVFLISATWCGYCKYDILKTMEWRAKPHWPKEKVVVIHMLAPTTKQDLTNAETFIEKPQIRETELNLDGIDFYLADVSGFNAFKEMKTSNGSLLFPELTGTPYAVIFDKDGKMQFRGHYTNQSDDHSAYYNDHYQFIGEVADGKCSK